MRHARREMRENLITIARIATGGQQSPATHFGAAPGRTYHELARRRWLENLTTTARDRSTAMDQAQSTSDAPGSPYSNSLAKFALQSNDCPPARGASKRET